MSNCLTFSKRKKAQIGSTISWFFAIIAIFFILLIFLLFSGMVVVQSISWSDRVIGISQDSGEEFSGSYLDFRGAVALLESPHEDTINRKYFSYDYLSEGGYVEYNPSEEEKISCYAYSFKLLPSNVGRSNWVIWAENTKVSPEQVIKLKMINLDTEKLEDWRKAFNEINFGARYDCEK